MRQALVLSLVLLATTAAATKTKPQTMTGEAVVRTIGDNRVAVLLDTNDDKAIDQGFLLSSDLPVSSTNARYPMANVEFTDGYVRVIHDGTVFDLYVAGYPEPPDAPNQTSTTRFIGYALMHSSGTSGCNLDGAVTDAGKCYGYGKD